ncbi:MAG: type II secretion system protein GspL [Desulfurivibrionaceae bacterium]
MAKRLIGIDIGRHTLRLAVLTHDQGTLSVVSVLESPYEETADQVARLRDTLHGDFNLGDRLAACLPGGAALVRRLTFPFSDRRKIAAAVPFELASQLPVALDDYTTVMQPPVRNDAGATIVAAAVKTVQLAETLAPFDAHGIPLHILDLAPYAYVAGLKDFLVDGILVSAMEQGTSLALVRAGEVLDYRQLPFGVGMEVTDQAQAIHREATLLGRSHQPGGLSLQLMGPLATPELLTALSTLRDEVEILSIDINGQTIEAPFLPAVALALRAADTGKPQAFNLRQGPFVLKSEWAGLRKNLLLIAGLTGLVLITLGVSMGLRYYDKQHQVRILEQQMAALYKQSFPKAATVVDVPMQMKSAIRQVQEDSGIIGAEQLSSLQLLRILSELPKSLSVDVDEVTMERNEVRISGRTTTFEEVNRMAETFRHSPDFEKVEVAESKMDLDGKRVSYRLRMILSGKGGAS